MESRVNLYSHQEPGSFGSLWLTNFGIPMFIEKNAANLVGERTTNPVNCHNASEPDPIPPTLKCKDCSFTSDQQSILDSHMKTKHKPKKLYPCDQCDFVTTNRGNLTYHISKHTGEKPFKCDYCDHRSRSSAYLKIHIRAKHTGEKPYACKECSFATPHSNALKSHIAAKHTGEKKYKCDMCDFAAVHSGNLKYHINSKHKEKPFKCHLCDYSAGHNGNLKTHIETKHMQDKKFKCPECDYSTGHQGNFKHHLKSSHDIDPSSDYVPQSFSSPSSQESSTSTSLYPYKCTQCPAFFHYPGKLVSHITEKHNFISESVDLSQSDGAFKCSECSFSTHEKDTLEIHKSEKHSTPPNNSNNFSNHPPVSHVANYSPGSTNFSNSPSITSSNSSTYSNPVSSTRESNRNPPTSAHHKPHPENIFHISLIYERNGSKEVMICPPCYFSTHDFNAFEQHLYSAHPINKPCCFKCEVCELFAMDLANIRSHMSSSHSNTCFFKVIRCGAPV